MFAGLSPCIYIHICMYICVCECPMCSLLCCFLAFILFAYLICSNLYYWLWVFMCMSTCIWHTYCVHFNRTSFKTWVIIFRQSMILYQVILALLPSYICYFFDNELHTAWPRFRVHLFCNFKSALQSYWLELVLSTIAFWLLILALLSLVHLCSILVIYIDTLLHDIWYLQPHSIDFMNW